MNDTRVGSGGMQDGDAAIDFMLKAWSSSQQYGVVALEAMVCPSCQNTFAAHHFFQERIPCPHCNHSVPSLSPRMPVPGEVTGDMLDMALHVVRSSYPEVAEDLKKWMSEQGEGVRLMAQAWASIGAREAIDKVRSVARDIAGSHGYTTRLVVGGKP